MYNSAGQIVQLKIKTLFSEPITSDGVLQYECNCINFQNVGNTAVQIDDRWTILPGGMFADGSSDNIDLVSGEFPVKFYDMPGVTYDAQNPRSNRLEIAKKYTAPCGTCVTPLNNIVCHL